MTSYKLLSRKFPQSVCMFCFSPPKFSRFMKSCKLKPTDKLWVYYFFLLYSEQAPKHAHLMFGSKWKIIFKK